LYRIDKHICNGWRDLKAYHDAELARSHESEGACFFKQPGDPHDRLVTLPAGNEIAQTPDNIPARRACSAALPSASRIIAARAS